MIKPEQLKEAFQKVPEEIQKIFSEDFYGNTLAEITRKYQLHIDQSGILSNEISAVILGLISRQSFASDLRKNLGISEDTANLIIYDLNHQIFSKVKEQIQNSQEQMGALKQASPSPRQIFDQKMSGVSNVPKQEVEVKTETGDNGNKEASAKPPRDPYREPID